MSYMRYVAMAMAFTIAVTGCGRSLHSTQSFGSQSPWSDLTISTPKAQGKAGVITWAMYRAATTVDPITAFDYPEQTVTAELCDAVQLQTPDGGVTAGLATLTYRTPLEVVLQVRSGVKFWDGHPLTAADVVYSLNRQRDPKLAGDYGSVFDRVKSITATGPMQVTIRLIQPDYWLQGELSGMPGVVIEKSYAMKHLKNYGTPSGGAMCTGAYELKHWVAGGAITVKPNPNYWNKKLQPRNDGFIFEGVTSDTALTSGLLTGAINGVYITDTTTLPELKRASNLKVYQGPALDTDFFIPTNFKGVLGNVKVRQALSLAFDRDSYIATAYDGTALLPKLASNPGYWGYERQMFNAAWNRATAPTIDLQRARMLIKQAHAVGKTLVIGTSSQLGIVEIEAEAWQTAADSIGLNAKLYNASAQTYSNWFSSPQARRPLDAFISTLYGNFADPTALTATYMVPDGFNNFNGFSDPAVTKLLNKARASASPKLRAKYTIAVEKLASEDLAMIPTVQPNQVLVVNKKLTGAPASFAYMAAPYLALLGKANR